MLVKIVMLVVATVVSDGGAGFRLRFRGKRDGHCGVHGWHDGGDDPKT